MHLSFVSVGLSTSRWMWAAVCRGLHVWVPAIGETGGPGASYCRDPYHVYRPFPTNRRSSQTVRERDRIRQSVFAWVFLSVFTCVYMYISFMYAFVSMSKQNAFTNWIFVQFFIKQRSKPAIVSVQCFQFDRYFWKCPFQADLKVWKGIQLFRDLKWVMVL